MIYYVYIIKVNDLVFLQRVIPRIPLSDLSNITTGNRLHLKNATELVALFSFEEQSHALRFEKRVKKYGHKD